MLFNRKIHKICILQMMDDWLGQTCSNVLWFVGMKNLLVQNHNHYTTAKAIYSVAQEREIEGMLC